jgi:hypothetical protein
MKLTRALMLIVGLLLIAVGTFAQEPSADTADASPFGEEPRLIFEREVFDYVGAGRRDPFSPLTGRDELGPIFEDLTLRMIISSDVASQSIAVLADATGRTYRLRRGESVGNSTIVEITPTRVVFSVDNLGTRRQEAIALKKNTDEGF